MRVRLTRFLELCRPDRTAESVAKIDPAELTELGIEGVLVDLDNTLVPWHGYEVPDAVLEWLRSMEARGIKICIVSNTRYPGRLRRLAGTLEVPFVKGRLKPRKSAFRPALELLRTSQGRTAVIGDQIFTDILGGNRLGLFTILVRPLSPREFFGTKISRVFERLILRAVPPSSSLGCEAKSRRSDEDKGEQSPDEGSQSKAEQ